jgi:radical SAM superfamily enzyme YgiQ (UPF0313 family)
VYGFYPIREEGLIAQPLALGIILESARVHENGILNQTYDFSPGVFYSLSELEDAVAQKGPGVCLFSNYVWTIAENLVASNRVKGIYRECVTIHGGPSTPKYPQGCAAFLLRNRHVDIAVRGEGESAFVELLDRLRLYFEHFDGRRLEALESVDGISFLAESRLCPLVRTAERPVPAVLDDIPSPYLSGFFDRHGWDFSEKGWNPTGRVPPLHRMLILETNRGCPYGCTFCDWGSATLQKIRLFSLERVRSELQWMAQRWADYIYIADANFGILPRDLDIALMIADVKARWGFPTTVATNYSKNGSDRLPRIFRVWANAGIEFEPTISIQSTDVTTLQVIRRSNIKTSIYLALSDTYREMNLPTRVQLMFGLPGATLDSWKSDLQFFFDRLENVQGFKTQLLPNSPMADPVYLEKYQIRTDQSGYVTSCSSFREEDHAMMEEILRVYQIFHNFALLKWFLTYLQRDHGIQALDYMHTCAVMAASDVTEYPELRSVLGPESVRKMSEYIVDSRSWAPFYRDVAEFTTRTWGLERSAVCLNADDFFGYARLCHVYGRRLKGDVFERKHRPAGFYSSRSLPSG